MTLDFAEPLPYSSRNLLWKPSQLCTNDNSSGHRRCLPRSGAGWTLLQTATMESAGFNGLTHTAASQVNSQDLHVALPPSLLPSRPVWAV